MHRWRASFERSAYCCLHTGWTASATRSRTGGIRNGTSRHPVSRCFPVKNTAMPDTAQKDPYKLQRFVDAQGPVYESVRSELRAGRKDSHWMWFIFPQLRGLGHSSTAMYYGISGLEETRAYLEHPILGARLIECCRLVNQI